jgi:hypothetical protein
VSVRSGEQFGTYGNRILLMAAPLFTDVADPVVRLHRTHEAMCDMKEHHKALPADLLRDANHFVPPRRVRPRRAADVPGGDDDRAGRTGTSSSRTSPARRSPVLRGRPRRALHPVSVITDGMGLNITVMSYLGSLDFGIVADRDQMPDVAKLTGWLRDALDELR